MAARAYVNGCESIGADLPFRRILDRLPVGAYTCDADGHITYYNSHAARIWGREPKLHDPADRYCGSFKLFSPDGTPIDHDRCWLALALKEQKEYRGRELVIERPDGRRLTVLAHASPMRDASGRPLGAVNVLVDISHRKQAEDALRGREATMCEETRLVATLHRIGQALTAQLELDRLVQEITNAATELTGADFGALFYNREGEEGEAYQLYTLAGAPREAFEDFPMPRNTAIFGPTFRGESVVRSDDITRDARYGRMAPHFGMPPGHLPVRSYLAVPVVSRTGEVLGGLFFGHEEAGIFTEKHERLVEGIAGWAAVAIDNARLYDAERRAHAAAVEASRAKSEFLAVMSHELRTPLNAIIGYGDLLLAGLAGPISERQQEYLDRIRAAAWHQLDLVDRILSLARIEARQEIVDRCRVNVVDLIHDVVTRIRPQATAKGLNLRLHTPPDGLELETDAAKLRQIVVNLLNNAVKFTESGEVEVRLEVGDEALRLHVRDTGMGIAEEDRDRIFEAFTQLNPGPTRPNDGTGLGLTIAQHHARLLGGDIAVESEVGRGSTFTLHLPLHTPAARTRDVLAPGFGTIAPDGNAAPPADDAIGPGTRAIAPVKDDDALVTATSPHRGRTRSVHD